MKHALILHGTDATSQSNWFPWLKQKLEEHGYEVWIPELPGNHTPNRQTYNEYLLNSGFDLENGIVIGHSAGAVSVLNLLMDERCPRMKLGIMAGAWAQETWDYTPEQQRALEMAGFEKGQFSNLFPKDGFDFETIKAKAEKLAFIHGDNDPFCPLEQAQWLSKNLDAEIVIVPNGRHLSRGFTELPEVWDIIQKTIHE
ncbi:MAG TPA: alpha/beta fold hydrolase [Candidatus Saccharimonadales bacterium]|nr:alpha/beta fold hydrolase [Candidatus Saccharimonadales bacterium]